MRLEENANGIFGSSATRPGTNARIMLVTGGGGFIGSHLVEGFAGARLQGACSR